MGKRTEDWIHIIQPDNENKIASPAYVAKLLGLTSLKEEIEARLNRLEYPMGCQQILELLQKYGGKHTRRWFEGRISIPIDYRHFADLVNKGKLIVARHGCQTVYGLAEEME